MSALPYIGVAVGLSGIIWAAWSNPAHPHEWYPYACCSNRDCFEVGLDQVTATKDGWRVESSGEVLPYDDPRIREFPDDAPLEARTQPHVCYLGGNPELRVLCLYVPEYGS